MIRKTIAILFCLLVSHIGFCQGNLQFNQVLTYAGQLYQDQGSPQYTVPEGKVWKLEMYTKDYMVINGSRFGDNASNLGVIWLKAGDTFSYYVWNYAGNLKYLVSIVEFNVVP